MLAQGCLDVGLEADYWGEGSALDCLDADCSVAAQVQGCTDAVLEVDCWVVVPVLDYSDEVLGFLHRDVLPHFLRHRLRVDVLNQGLARVALELVRD